MSESVGEAHIDVHADARGLTGEVQRAADTAARGAQVEVGMQLEHGAARELRAEAAEAADRANTTVRFTADADFARLGAQARAAARAAQQRVQFIAHLETRGFTLDRELGVFRRQVDGSIATTGELERALADLDHQARRTGAGIGGVGGALENSIVAFGARAISQITGFGVLIGAVIPYVVALVAELAALVTVAIQAAGVVVALGAAVGALAGGFLVAKVGTMGVADAFKAQQKALDELNRTGKVSKKTQEELDAAMKKLAPSARNFVKEVEEMRPAFDGLRKAVQQALFLDLGDMFERTAKEIIPVLTTGMVGVAKAINDVALSFLNWVRSAEGTKTIGDVFKSISTLLPPVLRILGKFALGIANLFIGATPGAKTFLAWLEKVADRFVKWTKKISEDGSLTTFMLKAQSAFRAIMGLAGDLIGLFTAFSDTGGLQAGLDLIDKFRGKIQELTTWLRDPANAQKIQDFWDQVSTNFDRFLKIIEDTDWGRVLSDLQGLADLLFYLGEAIAFLISNGALTNVGSVITDIAGLPWGDIIQGIKDDIASGDMNWPFLIYGLFAPLPAAIGATLDTFGPQISQAFTDFFAQTDIDWAFVIFAILLPVPAAIAVGLDALAPAANEAFANWFTGFVMDWGFIIFAWLLPLPAAIAAVLGTFLGPIGDAFTAFFSSITIDWVRTVFAIMAPFPAALGAFLAGVQIDWGAIIFAIFAPVPALIFNFITTMTPTFGEALGSWFITAGPAALIAVSAITGPFIGLAAKIFGGTGSFDAFLRGWLATASVIAAIAVAAIISPFAGLAAKIFGVTGSFTSMLRAWFSGAAGIAATAVASIISPFIGLGLAISREIGTVQIATSTPDVAAAHGAMITSPTHVLAGEAGPEVIVPLRRNMSLDPQVENLLATLAIDRGLAAGDRNKKAKASGLRDINIQLPTGDPEAAAMAVFNRLVFEGVI